MQYTGRENDGTGLYYYRNRYYSPNLRRFISRDPLREGASENEYSYVSNNPISLTDPLGLQEGPINALRDPFSPDHWVLNGASNTVSDLLGLDAIAASAWTLGNWCKPMSERLWAAAHLGSEIVLTVFGGKIIKGAGGAIFKRIPCNPFTSKWLGKACFVKGTLIHTREGLVPIEEIKSGDEVLSYNQDTKQTEYKSVVETYIRQTEQIVKLQIEGEAKAIETTPEHPFFVKTYHKARDSIGDDGEWRDAGSLQIGDEVLSASGKWQKISNIKGRARNETVYNFQVEDNHNYFVSHDGILVHNASYSKILGENLENSGLIRPAETAAHHIVAATDARAAAARSLLQSAGIGINDAVNGVFLPRFARSVNPTGAAVHSGIHTDAYYRTVESLLRSQSSNIPAVLNNIRNGLLNNTFPF